jgi:hypothetical protein
MLPIELMATSVGELQRNYLYKTVIETIPLQVVSNFPEAVLLKDVIDVYNTKGIFPARKTDPIQLWWAGEQFNHSGRDASPKTGDLTFRLSQDMKIKDFFEAAKDLTGDSKNHAAVNKPFQTLTLGVYMVSVDKKTVTDYRQLINVLVLSVEDITLDKEGSDVSTFRVNIAWDKALPNNLFRGKVIG